MQLNSRVVRRHHDGHDQRDTGSEQFCFVLRSPGVFIFQRHVFELHDRRAAWCIFIMNRFKQPEGWLAGEVFLSYSFITLPISHSDKTIFFPLIACQESVQVWGSDMMPLFCWLATRSENSLMKSAQVTFYSQMLTLPLSLEIHLSRRTNAHAAGCRNLAWDHLWNTECRWC